MKHRKQTRRSFIEAMFAGTSLAFLPFGADATPGNSRRPNIVVFLVDDMGLMDTSVPMLCDDRGNPERHPLNDWYRTPNMEKLAANGIRFSHFYAHSVCSPSRISLMTGQNSSRHGATQWIAPTRNNKGEFGPPDWNWEGLKGGDTTLPRLLQGHGYGTIHCGKAHLAPQDHIGADPTNLGFDINIGGTHAGQPGSYYGKDGYGNIRGRKVWAVPHLEKYHGTDTYLTEALTLEANKALDRVIRSGKPFFLHMAHYAVHAPFQSDPRFAENYSGKSDRAQAYATMIEGIDKSLGDIIANLKRQGVAEDTLIMFLGDNGSDAPLGPVHGYASSAPLLGKKGTHHEGGMRVPFIAAWAAPDPGNSNQRRLPIAAGEIHAQLGAIYDLMPTICNLADVEIPSPHPLDGVDLKMQLGGRLNPDRPNFFLNHFPHEHRSSYYTSFVKDDWKLVYLYPLKQDQGYELFNLKKDPYEKNNLAEKNPVQLQRMIAALKREMEDCGALLPIEDGEALSVK